MYEKLLEKIGLTGSEVAVYQALVKLGSSTTGPIVEEAGISSGKIYEILGKLIERGLATYIIKSGTKYFQATAPERLVDYVEKKERELKDIKKDLEKAVEYFELSKKQSGFKQQAEIFEGIEGFKTFSEFCLKALTPKADYCILGVSKEVNEKFGGYLLDWQKRRVEKGVPLRIIYNSDAFVHGQKREKLVLTQVRYLSENLKTPALIEIFDDYVATAIVIPKPVVFLIKSREAADSYLKYFHDLKNKKIIDFEIIVVLNNCTDSTLNVVERYECYELKCEYHE